MEKKKRKNSVAAKKLRKFIEEKGIKKLALANQLNISTSLLWNILNNGFMPNIELAVFIEKMTGNKIGLHDWVKE